MKKKKKHLTTEKNKVKPASNYSRKPNTHASLHHILTLNEMTMVGFPKHTTEASSSFQSTPQKQGNRSSTRHNLKGRKVSSKCLSRQRRPDSNLAAKKWRSISDLLDRLTQDLSSGFSSNTEQDMGIEMSYKQENR